MARHRSPGTTPVQRVGRAVRAALVACTGVGVFAVVGQTFDQSAEADSVVDAVVAHSDAREHRLMRSHHCAHDGVRGVFPQSALVLVHGEVRLVSFARGWAMYEHEVPGTLLAVCADPVRR